MMAAGGDFEEGLTTATHRYDSRSRVEANPLAMLFSALAIGGGVGALLPLSSRERGLLGPVADKINEAAHDAANTAVEAGRQQVEEMKQNAMAKVGEAVVRAVVSG